MAWIWAKLRDWDGMNDSPEGVGSLAVAFRLSAKRREIVWWNGDGFIGLT
jgi:hypothetical protein